MKALSRLLIADDHPIFRKGLRDILQEYYPAAEIIECNNGADALEYVRKHVPEVTVLDVNMPEMNGLDVSKQILKEGINTRVIILTMFREKEMIKKAMLSGAYGYILKDNAVDEIIDCINKVWANEKYVGSALMPHYTQINQEDRKKQDLVEALKSLSQGELKTLKLVNQNRTSKEIAELLFLSEKTIENYRSRICQKLGLPPRNNSLVLWINEHKELFSFISEF